MSRYRAYIVEDPMQDPFLRTIRLMVVEEGIPSVTAGSVLMGDGTWQVPTEGTVLDGAGIILPREALPAIEAAVERWQGRANHGATEAAVLREWLAVERERVDRALGCP